MPDPDGTGLAKCITNTLQSAGVAPEDVDYINAHGTSTPYNDKFETAAIKSAFGDHASKLMISSPWPKASRSIIFKASII